MLANGNIFLPLSVLTDAQRLMLHNPELLEQITPELLAAGMGAVTFTPPRGPERPRGPGAGRDVRARRRRRRAARDDPVPRSNARPTRQSWLRSLGATELPTTVIWGVYDADRADPRARPTSGTST